MKEMIYITIKGSIAFKRGQDPHIYLTEFNPNGPAPMLAFTSPEAVTEWIKNKIKEKAPKPKKV